MRAELAEIRDFLAESPPFSLLAASLLDALPAKLAVRYLRRGSAFPPPEEAGRAACLIRQGAVELRDAGGRLLARLAEGDLHESGCHGDDGSTAGTSKVIGTVAGTAIEDCLVYLLPCEELQALRRADPRFDAYLARSIAAMRRHARSVDQSPEAGGHGRLLSLRVADFVRRAPITGTATLSIAEAAARMAEAGVSALLIVDGAGALEGIVTDRDLRNRCLARGVAPEHPVGTIMTAAVRHIGPEAAAFEALMDMTRHGTHHLPVVDAGGLRGIVTSTDLLRWHGDNTIYLAAVLRRAESPAALAAASHRLAELQVALAAAGATAGQIAQALSSLNDVTTARLLDLAEARLGQPPVPYAWLACGSQGRHEQTVHSDQDNALILDDGFRAEAHEDYFAALAQFVNDGLDACGYRYCPGKVMASNPQWRQPLAVWRLRFRQWVAHCDHAAAMLVANFADLRVVAGEAGLHAPLLADLRSGVTRHQGFLAQMVREMCANRPPLGFFRQFLLVRDGQHAPHFDGKRQGLLPIVDIARLLALGAGLAEVGTVARIDAAEAASTVSAEAAAELRECFDFLSTLRLRHQVAQIRRGEAPDNLLDPAALTALEARHLKDVFAFVAQMQDALAQRHGNHSETG
jgi:CBS domain-containing protein